MDAGRVKELLARGASVLETAGPSARADAAILFAHALGCGREWLIAHDDAPIDAPHAAAFMTSCKRRALGEPVAYIVGQAWFYGRAYAVDENVLIPRPETEHLVDEALAFAQEPVRFDRALRVLDVGTGSGAIACAIAAECVRANVDAVDVSPAALRIARENARRLGVAERCRFLLSDLVTEVTGTYDVVVANLPYVPSSDVPAIPDPVGFEPAIALDGGIDGLTQYRRLLPALRALLRPGGLALMEGAPPVIEGLYELARGVPHARLEVCRDYAGLRRYVRLQASEG